MRLQDVLQALADPTRRAIIEALKEGDRTPSELLRHIPVAQPTLSHHLDRLRRAGLVRVRREGRYLRYSLDMSALDLVLHYLLQLREGLEAPQTLEETP